MYKAKLPLIEEVQECGMGVSIIVIQENISCYLFCGEVLVTERMPATSLFHFCLSPSSDGP
jgi:hypothetical protein